MSWIARFRRSVQVMCPPTYLSNEIKNNYWMMTDERNTTINRGRAFWQWLNLYEVVSSAALVYLLPPIPGLQDMTFVNSFVVLGHTPHIAVLSNFRAAGRAGEEKYAGELLIRLGFKVYKAPPYFEGWPELKYLFDDIYVAGYGERSTLEAQRALADRFDYKIIEVPTTKELYHLDCLYCKIDAEHVLLCESVPRRVREELEKYVEVILVSEEDAMEGICNSIVIGPMIINADHSEDVSGAEKERVQRKNLHLQQIAEKLGFEVVFVNLSEFLKSGALASCMCAPLNYVR